MSFSGDTSGGRFNDTSKALTILLVITGLFLFIGCVNVYSSTFYMNLQNGTGVYSHLFKHLIYLCLGLFIAMGLIPALGNAKIRQMNKGFVIITVLLLIAVLVVGRTVNGATRWIMMGPISLQPSEIAKVVGIIWTASYLTKKMKTHQEITILKKIWYGLFHRKSGRNGDTIDSTIHYFTPLYIPFLMAILVLKEPDMGTAGMILCFPLMLYFIAGLPYKEVGAISIIVFISAGILAYIEPYRWDRIKAVIDPFSYESGLGYQTVQGLIAIGSGGLFGQGAGEGVSKFSYLPEQYTDFAYAIFGQEWGFLGAFSLLFLYILFMICGFILAGQTKYTYESFLIYGLTMLISAQGLINIAMILGCFPVTGIPLPFISYGGTSLVINLVAVGLIREAFIEGQKKRDQEERKRHIAAMEGHPFR